MPKFSQLTRARIVLVARQDSVEALARRLGCSGHHIHSLFAGRRGASRRLSEGLFREFGPKAWAFVIGATNKFDLEEIA